MRIFCTLLLATAAIASAQPGPAVGTKVPDFQAPDQDGKVHTLNDLMGRNGLMLVFFRSADW